MVSTLKQSITTFQNLHLKYAQQFNVGIYTDDVNLALVTCPFAHKVTRDRVYPTADAAAVPRRSRVGTYVDLPTHGWPLLPRRGGRSRAHRPRPLPRSIKLLDAHLLHAGLLPVIAMYSYVACWAAAGHGDVGTYRMLVGVATWPVARYIWHCWRLTQHET